MTRSRSRVLFGRAGQLDTHAATASLARVRDRPSWAAGSTGNCQPCGSTPLRSASDRPRCQWSGIRCEVMGRTEIVRDSRPWGVGRTGPGAQLGTGDILPRPHPSTPHPVMRGTDDQPANTDRKPHRRHAAVRSPTDPTDHRPAPSPRHFTQYWASAPSRYGVGLTSRSPAKGRSRTTTRSRLNPTSAATEATNSIWTRRFRRP